MAIVGANGSGKSTLLRALAGGARAAGTIAIGGADPAAMRPRERGRAVALVAADVEPVEGTTVRELVESARYAHRPWWAWTPEPADVRAVEGALEHVGLAGRGARAVASLSSGERRLAWLALAVAQAAKLVLLDEPTAHLDPRHALEVLRVARGLAAGGRAAVVVLHDLNEAAAFADRVAVVGEGGVLAFAPPREALAPAVLERAYGIPFERVEHAGVMRVFPSLREPARG